MQIVSKFNPSKTQMRTIFAFILLNQNNIQNSMKDLRNYLFEQIKIISETGAKTVIVFEGMLLEFIVEQGEKPDKISAKRIEQLTFDLAFEYPTDHEFTTDPQSSVRIMLQFMKVFCKQKERLYKQRESVYFDNT